MPVSFFDKINTLWQLWYVQAVTALLIAAIFTLLGKPITKGLLHLTLRLAKSTGSKAANTLISAFEVPLRVLIALVGIFIACRVIPAIYGTPAVWNMIVKIFRSCMIFIIAWGLYNLEDAARLIAAFLVKRLDLQTNNVLMPFLSKTLRFITIAIALLVIAQEWNFSISGLLAGLGLGGLAFALAAKDMLANIFGGVVVLVDKPFGIGDWIKSNDTEGTVEDITFRSVKVRTFDQALVTIPNSEIVNKPVTNYSRMGKRKVNFSLTIHYKTSPESIKSCVERTRSLLLNHDEILSDSVAVALESIGAGGLSMMIYFYTKTTDWQEYLKLREKVFFEILNILSEENAELAQPAIALEHIRP